MYDSLVAHKVNQYCPEVTVETDKYGRWHWSFRCVTSEDFRETEGGFDTALDALCAFTRWTTDSADELLEALIKDDD